MRVLIAEDSAVARELLVLLLEGDPAIEVVGAVHDGAEAVERAESLRPDVVLMDVHMPRLNGYDATRLIMARAPVPIVMVSATVDPAEMASSFEALAVGAVALVPKPAGPGHPEHEATVGRLLQTVKSMAEVPVVRRWAARRTPPPAPVPSRAVRVLAIGASTGGPQVIAQLMRELPAAFDPPILIVQHIAAGFVQGLAEWLARMTTLAVKVAVSGDPIRPRTVYVAPEGAHLEVGGARTLLLVPPAESDRIVPSVDRLFRSVAKIYGSDAAGVLLTGMGRDGAAGLLELRRAGAVTIAQDEASSVVFGMPGEAVKLGAAEWVLSPDQISRAIGALAIAS